MKTNDNTILITGGATGIGFLLTETFVNAGNEVIICGRRDNKLDDAKKKFPQIHTIRCDLSREEDRKSLYDHISSNFKNINILINNAGIQRMIDFKKGTIELFAGEDEIEINFKAYVHLSAYFIPLFLERKEAAIINISSGLGFVPLAITPVYSATKAAIHSFSKSLRHQLRNTPIKVFEVIPPTVNTDLDKGARDKRGQTNKGIPPSEVAKATINGLEKDEFEIAVGMAQNLIIGSRNNPEQIFQNINRLVV
ncbi:MAG: SDR family NAD(P)-dependent oxidoreductase [Methanotrichaceae archaeon]|nr:SDR family NAD(P)-dependent oxidoreductase [Methanotrichaceae archaeon]